MASTKPLQKDTSFAAEQLRMDKEKKKEEWEEMLLISISQLGVYWRQDKTWYSKKAPYMWEFFTLSGF